jgi:hypothetical protein
MMLLQPLLPPVDQKVATDSCRKFDVDMSTLYRVMSR